MNKAETTKKYEEEKELVWRRSFGIRPPGGESLKDTFDRVVPYYLNEIRPKLNKGRNMLIVAHRNCYGSS